MRGGGGWGITTHIESAAGTGVSDSRSAPRWGTPPPLLDGGTPPPLLDGVHCRRSSPAAENRLPHGSSPHCRRRRPLPVGGNRRGAWGGLQPNGRFVVSLGCLRRGYLGLLHWPAGLQGLHAGATGCLLDFALEYSRVGRKSCEPRNVRA